MLRVDELEEIQEIQRQLSTMLRNINLLGKYTENESFRRRLMILFSWVEIAHDSVKYTLETIKEEESDGEDV